MRVGEADLLLHDQYISEVLHNILLIIQLISTKIQALMFMGLRIKMMIS